MSSKAVSSARADAEAYRIAEALASPPCDGLALGSDLNGKLPPAARREVLARLPSMLRERSARPDLADVVNFLTVQLHDTKSLHMARQVASIMTCALRAPRGSEVAAAVLHCFISGTSADIPREVWRSLGTIKGVERVPGGTLSIATEHGTADAGFLARWNACLLPFLGLGSGGNSLPATEAKQILATLAALPAGSMPEELVLSTDRLKRLARGGGGDDAAGHGEGLPSPFREIAEAVHAASETHLREVAELRARVSDLEAGVRSLTSRLETEVQSSREQAAEWTAERDRLLADGQELRTDLARATREMEDARAEREAWAETAEIRRREADMLLDQRAAEERERLRAALDRPTANLRDRVRALVIERRDDRALRLLAAAFDILDQRVLRLIGGADEQRIPADLLKEGDG